MAAKKPLKVFVLAGQSNMVGMGRGELSERGAAELKKKGLSDEAIAKKGKGTLKRLTTDANKAETYQHIIDKDGQWIVRDDVQVYYKSGKTLKKGGLTVGFGAGEFFGPEFQFGHIMGDHYDEPVLLIKTAWGGKSLALYSPAHAGKPSFEINPRKDGTIPEPGKYYRLMMTEVKEVLSNLKTHFPEYNGQGYEITGFGWFQGWNDGCNEDFAKEYAKNMPLFIRDVRKDLGVPDLPFVIANSGFGGHAPKGGVVGRLQNMVQPAQAAAAQSTDNVRCIDTRDFYRPVEESPRGGIEHWYGNAESYFLIGDAMGKAMKQLLSTGKN